MSGARLCLSEELANFLLRKFLKRFPVKRARITFGEGFVELTVTVPVLGSFQTRLYPLEPLWGERKALRFRVEERGPVSLAKTAVQFIKEGVRLEGDTLEVEISKFWARLPEELRWGAKIERIEIVPGEARAYFGES